MRAWLAPAPPRVDLISDPQQRKLVRVELSIVFAITLGLSAASSLLSIVDGLLRDKPLRGQAVALNVSRATVQLIDFLQQLLRAVELFAWGALGLYLLYRAGIRLAAIGLDRTKVRRDLLGGAALA